MHFEKVQFPPTVIADLYKHSIVLLEDFQTKKTVTAREKASIETAARPEPAPPVKKKEIPAGVGEPIIAGDAITFKYLGAFEKQVSIVVTEHFHPHIADADLEFLSKLLAACKLSLRDVAIINLVSNPHAARLWELMPSKALLLFDVDHAAVGLSFRRPHFEIQEWSGSQFMSAPALEQFRTGPDADVQALKRKLWTGLQKIFLGK